MATVNLGRIKFVWQGAYNGATAYVADDVVSYNGSSYICILASTGNLPTNTTYWSQMSSKGTDGTNGTNGTDLTTTLTTQGDIVYRSASGLARLGAGTSGQFLKTNGAGANPAWATVSSDFVKLAETSASNVSSVALNGYFTSDYDVYKIYVDGVYGSANAYATLTFNTTGSYTEQTSNYYFIMGSYVDSASAATTAFDYAYSSSRISYNYIPATQAQGGVTEMTIYNPLSTIYQKYVTGNTSGYYSSAAGYIGFSGAWKDATAVTGLTFKMSTGNIYARKIRLYGIKN